MLIPDMKYFLLRDSSIFYFDSLIRLFLFYLAQKRLYPDYASGVVLIGEISDFETGNFETIYHRKQGGEICG